MTGGVRGNLMAAGTALALGLATREALVQRREAGLRGNVALVTGGSRGLGLAISRELPIRGAGWQSAPATRPNWQQRGTTWSSAAPR